MTVTQSFQPDKNAQLLFQTATEQGQLEVFNNCGFIWLQVNGVLQSAIELKSPYVPALAHCMVMLLPLLHDKEPSRILELGGGGLAIQRFLKVIRPRIDVLSIEIEPKIIQAVRTFFPASEQLNVTQADAFAFVQQSLQTGEQFDWLLMDLYHGACSPILSVNDQQLQDFTQVLTQQGWLILNCLTDEPAILANISRQLQLHFGYLPHLFVVPEMLNRIFMIKNSELFKFPTEVEQHNLNNPEYHQPLFE